MRGWLGYGVGADAPWSARVEVQHLDSENRNRVGATRTTDTSGARTRFGGRLTHRFALGATRHELTAAIEREEEDFSSRDLLAPAGPGNRDLSRARTAFVGEWRAEWGDVLVTDIAVRHDDFNRFEDATTLARQCGAEPRRGLLAARRLWRRHRPAQLRRSVRLPRLPLRRQSEP